MNPSKQQADLILTNATILTMNGAFEVFKKGAAAIRHGEILAVGPEKELLVEYSSSDLHDCGGKILMPGLVNTHTHVPMTLLRGLTDDRRLDVWLLGYMMPVEREFVSPEFCRLGTQIACAELIRSGVTTFADMYYFEDSVADVTAEIGLRGICGETILKYPTPDAPSYEDALAYMRDFAAKWKGHELIIPSVAPHAPYSSTPEIIQSCTEIALEYDIPIQIHIAETAQEVEQFRKDYGMPVVPWVKKQGIFEAKVTAAHCVHIDEGEMHTLQHGNVGIAHNPSSNMKLASGFAPVEQMRRIGLNVGIGTDGTASNNDLDMLEEIRLANFIAKGYSGDPTALPAIDTLTMATIEGARALHMDHLIGSLEAGKKADLILIDLDRLHNIPHFNHDPNAIYSRIIYATKSSDVTDVMVNGKWLMRDKKLLTVNEEKLFPAASKYSTQIDAFLSDREGSVLSKLIAIGGAEREESYEIQIKVRLPDPEPVLKLLDDSKFTIIRKAHYREYDTYFTFDTADQGRLRYREDEFINDQGEIYNVRYRLTLTGPAAEYEYPNSILLSRSRFIAPANHSLRFYREYFQPEGEFEINKDRLRWLISYEDKEFFINIDQISKPGHEGNFLEIKSRTWSRRDAEEKARLITILLGDLGVSDTVSGLSDYYQLLQK
ncbi:MAG: amidohydrolase family protein [Anaerolineales bacterium]|nr:amidohydrolase family protein [Anaerolineales bacterium]